MAEACLGFLQLLFCGTVRQRKGTSKAAAKESEGDKVKIRVGFEGKDTLFSTENLNVKTTFGQFAVLLDYASNKLVPLHSSGSVMEPLEARKRYVVVLNTHGSSSHKWEDLRRHKGGSNKKHRKHGSGKHSNKKKRGRSSSTTSKPSGKHERKTAEEVKEPLLVQKTEEEEEDDDESEEEEEEEQKEKQQEHHVTNFATIDFGVSSSMDSMISNSREVYVY